MNSNLWFVCPQPNPKAHTRLFIFPYAGGGPSAFTKWCKEFPDTIEVWIVHYPGRGSRYKEAPIKELTVLVESIHQAIQVLLNKPFAFFGHSIGGLIAFELTRSLRRLNLPRPTQLFVSACAAPHIPNSNPLIHSFSDIEFLKSLKDLNGIPSEVLQHPDLMNLLLPTLRADFELLETYPFTTAPPLNCPIVAFGGLDDPRVSRERVEGWARHTDSRFESNYFPGGHFFINTAKEAITESITKEINFVGTRRITTV